MQKEFFGFDSLQNLQQILDEYDRKKIFVVTGKNSYAFSGAKNKLQPFFDKKEVIFFNDFSPNPDLVDIEKGIKQYRNARPDMILAVGGGSVIDTGKLINLLANNPGAPLEYVKGLKKPTTRGVTFVAIPTTSGTGSESTHFATVYVNKEKYSLADKQLLLPAVCIVDPCLTFSMPSYRTASTGLDALCQGIESLWSVHSTDESRRYAREAVTVAVHTLQTVVNNPDKNSRFDMAKAAHLSGKAINISYTTAAHSLSYPITSYFGISHGHAVALSMGQLIEFNASVSEQDCNDKRGVGFVRERLDEIIQLMDCENASDAKLFFQTLLEKIGVEYRLHKLNINDKERRVLIQKGSTPSRMNNNPRVVLKKDIQNIVDDIP